jgi:DNA-binding GntR family transcriptional regulator
LAANRGKSAAYELSRRIQKGELKDGFTARGVYRKQWSLLTDKETVYMALDELVEAGWLRKRVTPPAFQQRQATSYFINPKAK